MILEDDIIFENNILIYLNLALIELNTNNINWDILYLSINLKKKDDAIKISESLLKINKGLTTTGQIFKVKNIEKIIKLIERSEVEIDNTYELLENKYCVYPMCCYQRNSYSDINNTIINYGKFHQKFIY
jgi:GR25 family glycosyltransferase involved in LPS biosynthesis